MNSQKSVFPILVFLVLFSSCNERFPMQKRYWDDHDYYLVIDEIEYKTPQGEEYPRFSNPETSPVIEKLVDVENYKVVLEDPELGIKYKSEVSEKFFNEYRRMLETYSVMDRQDKYIYPEELAEIMNFGLGLQRLYFKLGNDRIKEESGSAENIRVVKENEQTLVNNYTLTLDNIIESRFGESGCLRLADAINLNYPALIELYPEANYKPMHTKAKALGEKFQTPQLKAALASLISKLEPKVAPKTEASTGL